MVNHRRGAIGTPGDPTFGVWVKLATLETVEVIAYVGFDFIVIDMEHSPLDFQSAYASLVVAQGAGLSVLARVPDQSGSHVQRLVDAGFDGILVPQVSTAEQAASCIQPMVFAPAGSRGMGVTSRAGKWGMRSNAEYLSRGRDIIRGVQIESRGGLAESEAILSTFGLNAVLIGMADLALSSGLAPDDPGLVAQIRRVLDIALAKGIPCGTAVSTPDEAAKRASDGYSFVLVGNDIGIFASALRGVMSQLRDW